MLVSHCHLRDNHSPNAVLFVHRTVKGGHVRKTTYIRLLNGYVYYILGP